MGVWISAEQNKNFIKAQIKQEIDLMSNKMRKKYVTSQQITYVFNAVILPRIEYRTNLHLFTEKELINLAGPVRKLLKLKTNLANTIPNALLWDKKIYNLINVFSRLIEHHSANLLNRINNEEQLGQMMEIRILQTQLEEWLPYNLLDAWIYKNIKVFNNNLTAKFCAR